jgi:hypothetical protein
MTSPLAAVRVVIAGRCTRLVATTAHTVQRGDSLCSHARALIRGDHLQLDVIVLNSTNTLLGG